MYGLFPFDKIERGCRLVLQGGGIAGKNYFAQILRTKWCEVVAVCDRNHQNILIRDIPIIPIEDLCTVEYDKILITQLDRKVRDEIKNQLIQAGIDEDKIISAYDSQLFDWNNPPVGFVRQEDEYYAKKDFQGYLQEIDPDILISSERIDIIVRYLLFRDFVFEVDNDIHLSLFSRFVFCRTGGIESKNYFSDEGKETVKQFVDNGRELCKSIAVKGYDVKKFIPLGHNNKPYDGLHRIAAALALGEKIWVRNYDDRKASICDIKWFKEHGFSSEDQIRIMRGFADTYTGRLGIFVLYAPCKKLWEYIESRIAQEYCFVGAVTVDFSCRYVAFDNILRQIYWDSNRASEWLTRKLELLYLADLQYRIVLVSDENRNYKDFYGSIHNMKKKLRECLNFDIDSNVPIQVHSSDTEKEYEHLKDLFLSANNLDNYKKNTNKYLRSDFLRWISSLKKWCDMNGISNNDVIIVGSAVMEFLGIRESHNLNFICRPGITIQYPNTDADLEMIDVENYFISQSGKVMPIEFILSNDEYYMVFNDMKFCNIEFVYRYKKYRNHKKDIMDIAKIEKYEKYVSYLEEKGALQQQIEIELMKRGLKHDYY